MVQRSLLGASLIAAMTMAACATTESLQPAGTAAIQVRVNNASAEPADFEVVPRPGAASRGAVNPPALPPNTEAEVTFYVPIAAGWTVRVNGEELFDSSEVGARRGVLHDMGIDIDVRGNPVWWCKATCR